MVMSGHEFEYVGIKYEKFLAHFTKFAECVEQTVAAKKFPSLELVEKNNIRITVRWTGEVFAVTHKFQPDGRDGDGLLLIESYRLDPFDSTKAVRLKSVQVSDLGRIDLGDGQFRFHILKDDHLEAALISLLTR